MALGVAYRQFALNAVRLFSPINRGVELGRNADEKKGRDAVRTTVARLKRIVAVCDEQCVCVRAMPQTVLLWIVDGCVCVTDA